MTPKQLPIDCHRYHGDDQSIERLQSEAKKMGFPIMIKAVLGGGGLHPTSPNNPNNPN